LLYLFRSAKFGALSEAIAMNVPADNLTRMARIREAAEGIVRATPGGIRWAELHRQVSRRLTDINSNTITGGLHQFRNNLPADIERPTRGLFVVADAAPAQGEAAVEVPAGAAAPREDSFYAPFAAWLKDDLEEATRAISLGGNGFGGKWGTPDVIGVYEPKATDPVKFSQEIIAAEIKTDSQQLIVAFGQAVAYRLFAHRVYLVVPRTANRGDLQRLDALASVVGIGLVLFNPESAEQPEFDVRVRAPKHEPDYFYTNHVITQCAAALYA
jgi:hypothetical protein